MNRRDIEFDAEGTRLSGWFWQPEVSGRHPVIVLSHGLSGIIDLGIEHYAQYFVDAGFACLAYDHRNWGRSGGWPRCESDPWRQVSDMREAISFVRTLPEVDPERLGIWGTSYSGGHVLSVGALDRRVRCVVSQVPLVAGRRTFDAWVPAEKREGLLARVAADRDARAQGQPAATTVAALPGTETGDWLNHFDPDGSIYVNRLTLRSLELLRSYEPISFVADIAPTPLLMVIADHDTQTPTEWQLEAFEQARDPKRLLRIDCRHYDPYSANLPEAATAATDWFKTHLL